MCVEADQVCDGTGESFEDKMEIFEPFPPEISHMMCLKIQRMTIGGVQMGMGGVRARRNSSRSCRKNMTKILEPCRLPGLI